MGLVDSQAAWEPYLAIVSWCLAVIALSHAVPLFVEVLVPRRPPPPDPTPPESGAWPEVTVVVPARNEGELIEAALDSLLSLDYPSLKVVAVDDRSTDNTGQLMDRLAASDPRLVVVHVSDLPAGWLGKNHANFVGALKTRSPWILFTDGDVLFERETLQRAIRHVSWRRVDHLALMPRLVPGGVWENLMVAAFSMFFAIRCKTWLVRTRFKPFYVGIGAFNLISRDAYERIGTHRRLAMEVADDLKLGKLVKQYMLRQDVLDGSDALRVRWQVGMRGVIAGLTKNSFAGLDYSLSIVAIVSVLFTAVFLAPYPFAVALGGPAEAGFACTALCWHAVFAVIVWRLGHPVWTSLMLPVASIVFLYIIWRSTWITLRQGGVVWRDTFYPLDELKRGLV